MKLGASKDLRSWLRGFVPTADGSPAQWLLERATTAWSETVRRGEYRAARATRRQRGANSTSVPTANSNIDIMALTTANIGRLSVPDLQKLVQTHQIPLPAAGTGRRSWRNADLNSMLLAHIDTLRQPERHRTAACNRREHDLEQQVEAASGRDGAITHERTEAHRDEFEQHALQQHGHREPLFAMPPAVVWAIMPLWAVPGHGPSLNSMHCSSMGTESHCLQCLLLLYGQSCLSGQFLVMVRVRLIQGVTITQQQLLACSLSKFCFLQH